MIFTAARHISSTPKTTHLVLIGHIDKNWMLYGTVEFLRRSGQVHRIWPSRAVIEQLRLDDLVQCAILFNQDNVVETKRLHQASWGIAPDLVYYERKGGS